MRIKILLLAWLLAIQWLLGWSSVAMAQTGCTNLPLRPVIDGTVKEFLQLAPPFVEEGGGTRPIGAFYRQGFVVNVEAGWQILISGSPDGRLGICTDDEARIDIIATGRAWSHKFANATETAIVPIASVDVTELFQTGTNELVISLTDLKEPAHSSSAYYLVLVESPTTTGRDALQDQANIVPQISVTNTPAPVPTFAPLPTDTVQATPTNEPTVTETSVDTPINAAIVATELPTPQPIAEKNCCFAFQSGIKQLVTSPLLILVSVLALIGWHLLSQPQLSGFLKIEDADRGTHEVISLQQFGASVTVGAEGKIRIVGDDMPDIAGRIFVKREDDSVAIFWQSGQGKDATEQTIEELGHGSMIQVGHCRLTYENLANVTDEDEQIDGGIWNEQEWT